jgi:hypothetical protein
MGRGVLSGNEGKKYHVIIIYSLCLCIFEIKHSNPIIIEMTNEVSFKSSCESGTQSPNSFGFLGGICLVSPLLIIHHFIMAKPSSCWSHIPIIHFFT